MNQEKVDKAITLLRLMQPHTEPYYVCYSGGKDSDVIRILCDMAGVDYELHNNHTTVDAPETVRYIREVMSQYGERKHVIDDDGARHDVYGGKGFIDYPLQTMWQLIVEKRMPPTRIARYCCAYLKERGGRGRKKVTGVRWAESHERRDGLKPFLDTPNVTGEQIMTWWLGDDPNQIELNFDELGNWAGW